MIDFSKAFDTINHLILFSKLKLVPVSLSIIKWIMSSLTNTSQSTKVNGVCSLSLDNTRSNVQGSGIGPCAFITYVSDFKTLGYCNHILKYTDDFSLLGLDPENSDVSAMDEVEHIISWSNRNKHEINLGKCKQLVFKGPNLKHEISPCTLPDVVRVN